MKRLLVTGANGFVAGSVLAQASAAWEVHATSRSEPQVPSERIVWHPMDPLAAESWARLFGEVEPQTVIHTAALADIDFCQSHPEPARAVNVGLTRVLAGNCAERGIRLVFCSTDTIFDGEHAPYREEDPAGPVNGYAETKVEAERVVACLGRQGVIARLALVVGLPVLGAGNSFLARMLAALREGRALGMSTQEARTPIDVITLGRALLELAANDSGGVFHLAGNDRLTRFEMARRIAGRFGFSPSLVFAQARSAVPGRAPRPRDVSLDNTKARAVLETPMRGFDDALLLIQRGLE